MFHSFFAPTKVLFGKGSINSIQLPKSSALIVVSDSICEPDMQSIINPLRQNSVDYQLVVKPKGEPESDDIDLIFSTLSSFKEVMSMGGGSTLDFAKALALLGGSGGSILDYEFAPTRINYVNPMILVPTTCGSGSEVTPYAVINNSNTGRKFTLAHELLFAKQAVIDPILLANLPHEVIISTSLDAFTHCLEALLTKTSTDLIWPLACMGLRIAWKYIPEVSAGNTSEHVLEKLLILSLYGGFSISSSRTGLIHTMSVAFAKHSSLPHGLLNACLLPCALRHNLSYYKGLLSKLMHEVTGCRIETDEIAYDILTNWLLDLDCIPSMSQFSSLAAHSDSIVERILQDKGLPCVCHGPTDESSLRELIRGVINEN
jgi:alcohol dehydrogenase class IV